MPHSWICNLTHGDCTVCMLSEDSGGCGSKEDKPVPGKLITLEEMIRHYQRNQLRRFRRMKKMYHNMPDLALAICCAANAREPGGRMSGHQWRIGRKKLNIWADLLLSHMNDIAACKDFEELRCFIESLCFQQFMIGELCVYDTALRISFFIGIEPDVVYVSAGSWKGANYMGLRQPGNRFNITDFTEEFSILTPAEIENFLCIYKDCLKHSYSNEK
jgi:hypothetical protein